MGSRRIYSLFKFEQTSRRTINSSEVKFLRLLYNIRLQIFTTNIGNHIPTSKALGLRMMNSADFHFQLILDIIR